jgi:hypothetical protein
MYCFWLPQRCNLLIGLVEMQNAQVGARAHFRCGPTRP